MTITTADGTTMSFTLNPQLFVVLPKPEGSYSVSVQAINSAGLGMIRNADTTPTGEPCKYIHHNYSYYLLCIHIVWVGKICLGEGEGGRGGEGGEGREEEEEEEGGREVREGGK